MTIFYVQGKRLNFGCDASDYTITVGEERCTGIEIPDNFTIKCVAPETLKGKHDVKVSNKRNVKLIM